MYKIVILFLIIFTSNNLFAKQNEYQCSLLFEDYKSEIISVNKFFYDDLDNFRFINIDFYSKSKNIWEIKKVYFQKDISEIIEKLINAEVNVIKKIINNENLNSSEKLFFKALLENADMSLSEFNKNLKKLSKKEKNDFINEYKKQIRNETDEAMKEFQNYDFDELIDMYNKNKKITVNGNNINIYFVTDAAVIFDINIDYLNIVKKSSKNAMDLNIAFVDGSYINFGSICQISNYQNTKERRFKNLLF